MAQQYYLEPFFHHWVIKDTCDESFVFGPFESESDAYFVMQMFNSKKLNFNKDDNYGEENTQESHTIY